MYTLYDEGSNELLRQNEGTELQPTYQSLDAITVRTPPMDNAEPAPTTSNPTTETAASENTEDITARSTASIAETSDGKNSADKDDETKSSETPPSPSQYSQVSRTRWWSEDSEQDSPATDASSVKHLSNTTQADKLGKIEEDDSSSQGSSVDRFFEMDMSQNDAVRSSIDDVNKCSHEELDAASAKGCEAVVSDV